MAIYLDQQTRPYLEKLIATRQDFIAKRIQETLKADHERLDGIHNCEHVFGKYLGEKECCTKCGTYDVGMGESWTLKETYDNKT
jgi:hypothetical protein